MQYVGIESLSGLEPISSNVIMMSYLTLFDKKGRIIVNKLSVLALQYAFLQIPFADLDVDWSRSFIEVPTTTGLVANTSFVFVLYSNKYKKHGR